ncbi:MAG TPA: GPW/gp25 family protein [Bacteroidia bacterium]|nr:GPW/gp25 family protein [Bacteroidia bacterium]
MDRQLSKQENNFLGAGWAFPVAFSNGNYQVDSSSYEKNINDSIDIILQTKNGERAFDPQFGSGLQQFFFKKMDETLKGEIQDAVEAALLLNEPRITVQSVAVEYADIQDGLVEITIVYIYNQTNTRHNYVFPFHLNEGTNLIDR